MRFFLFEDMSGELEAFVSLVREKLFVEPVADGVDEEVIDVLYSLVGIRENKKELLVVVREESPGDPLRAEEFPVDVVEADKEVDVDADR